MTDLSANLRLRPIRIGFLVDPADIDSLRRIMRICSCLWGGLYNPIIPVCETLPDAWKGAPPELAPTAVQLAKAYIEFFEPDVFVQASPDLSTALDIPDSQIEIGTQRISNLGDLLADDWRDRGPSVGLGVGGIYREMYDREFRFVPRHPSMVALFKVASTGDDAFVECVFGAFPTEEGLANLADIYRSTFEPEEFVPNAASWLKVFEEGYRFPLTFTRHRIERAPGGYDPRDPTFFIVDPSSPLDLIDFWNLRLFRYAVLPVNVHWFEESAPFMRDFITRQHRPLPGNPHGVMMHTTVEFGRSIGETRAKEVVEKSLSGLAPGSWALKLWYDRIWIKARDEDLFLQPRRSQFTSSSRDLRLAVSEDRAERHVSFDTLSPEFSPTYPKSSVAWVNVLRFGHYRSTSDWLLQFPNDFDPELVRQLRLGGGTIPSREGLVLPQHFKGHGEYLRILTGRDAMAAWLKKHGVGAEISSSGRVTEQVIASLDGLWGARLLADKATLQLLDGMAKSARRFPNGTVEEYPDRTASAEAWTSLVARRKQDLWSHNLSLDNLIDAGMLKLGLLIECAHCTHRNWFGISDLDEVLQCERCRKQFPFPQGRLNFVHSPWGFRAVGPFAVPDYADGAYATALALRMLAETLSTDVRLTYAPGLNFSIPGEEKPVEIDFSFWYSRDRWRDEQDVVTGFGEAKSFGDKCFTSKDVDRMGRVAGLFPGSFLIFAVLKEELHADEKAMIADLARWGRESLGDGRPRAPVIVLTGTELFSPWHVDDTWKKRDGLRKQFAENAHMRLENLWTLADATQQAYLDLPSRFDEIRTRWEAARSASVGAAENRPPPANGKPS